MTRKQPAPMTRERLSEMLPELTDAQREELLRDWRPMTATEKKAMEKAVREEMRRWAEQCWRMRDLPAPEGLTPEQQQAWKRSVAGLPDDLEETLIWNSGSKSAGGRTNDLVAGMVCVSFRLYYELTDADRVRIESGPDRKRSRLLRSHGSHV